MHVDKAPVRLPLRCTPFPGESLTGLLIRLAERNGLARVQMLGHVSIGKLPALYPTAIGLQRLAAASGIPSGTLEGMCFGQGIFGAPPKSVALQGVDIPVGWVTWKLAVCPACLAESPHHRTKWHLLLITVCPLHDCPILRACPACARRLRWERWPRSAATADGTSGTPGGRWPGRPTSAVRNGYGTLAGATRRLACFQPFGSTPRPISPWLWAVPSPDPAPTETRMSWAASTNTSGQDTAHSTRTLKIFPLRSGKRC